MLAAGDYSMIALVRQPVASPLLVAAQLQADMGRYALIGTFHMIAFAFTGLAFINWFHRAFRNLRALDNHDLRWSSGWTLAHWFIPIAWWFIPYQIMAEICAAAIRRRLAAARHWPAVEFGAVLVGVVGRGLRGRHFPLRSKSVAIAFIRCHARMVMVVLHRQSPRGSGGGAGYPRRPSDRHQPSPAALARHRTPRPAGHRWTGVPRDHGFGRIAAGDADSFLPPADGPSSPSASEREANMPWLDGD